MSASHQTITVRLQRHLQRRLAEGPSATAYLVAFSAGADSTALLHALSRAGLPQAIQAVHVDHGLQSQSEQWARLAQRHGQAWKIPVHIENASIQADGQGLEAAAREARYAALKQHADTGTVVLTAHHRDDQAETLLLHLLRGSGLRGLAGIPETRRLGDTRIFRPLLDIPGQWLRDYCHEQQLEFVEDTSNRDTGFDRNWLRHELLPLLQQRFPHAGDNLAHSAKLLAQALRVNQHYLTQLLEPMLDGQQTLALDTLQQQPVFMQHELLRHWITRLELPPPPRERLGEFIRQLQQAGNGKAPQLHWAGCSIRVYRRQLHAGITQPTVSLSPSHWRSPASWNWPGVGQLSMAGADTAAARHWPAFEVRQRSGGEAIKLADGHHHQLKTLFQQAGIPPWQRQRMPLVYHRGRLVAVADRWLHPGLQRWLQRRGMRWQWQPVR